MSIFRSVHDSQNPYCILNKQSLWDENLSLEAIAVWARLISRPNDWRVSIVELSRSCKKSRSKMYNIINELIDNGYAFRYQENKGKFARVEYLIFEKKTSLEEIQKILPLLHFSNAEISSSGKQTLLSNEEEILKKEKYKEALGAHIRAPHIQTTEEEHHKLVEEFGEEKTALLYKHLSEWKEDTPKAKWKKNDYRSILRWVVDALKSKKHCGEDTKALASRIANNFKKSADQKGIKIHVLNSTVEFEHLASGKMIVLSYEEKGFKDQLESIMRKIGLV